MLIITELLMEVQSHGNDYENLVIKRITGKGKKEYDKLKGKGGYTSSMDIVKGLLSDRDRSIKTTNGNKVDCGDILRRMREKEYEIIVGQYRQDGGNKVIVWNDKQSTRGMIQWRPLKGLRDNWKDVVVKCLAVF